MCKGRLVDEGGGRREEGGGRREEGGGRKEEGGGRREEGGMCLATVAYKINSKLN